MASTADTFSSATNIIKDFAGQFAAALKTNLDPSDIQTKILEVDVSAMQLAKSFGIGRDNIVNLKGAMTEAVVEITKLGGTFSDIARIQQSVGDSLGRNVVVATEAYERLFAAEQVAGKQVSEFLPKFKDVGVSTYQAASSMETIINTAREAGVNAQAVTSKMMTSMDRLNMHNFDGGVQGLAKMAAHATALRVDMSKTFEFADKVFNPEGAIETAAALQRLGVTQSALLDPLKMMDLSRNDPAELQKQISEVAKSFVTLNEKGRFEIMPGSQDRLREVAKALGMQAGELAKMGIGAEELNDKMQKIRFPDSFKEEDKQFIANMAEMNEKGEYVVNYKGEATEVNKLMETFKGDQKAFEQFMKDSKPKTLEELAREQLDATKAIPAAINSLKSRTGYAVGGSEMGEQTIEATIKTNNAIADSVKLDIKGIKETYESSMGGILESLTKSLKGEGSVEDLLVSLGEGAKKTQELLGTTFKNSIEEASKQLDKLKLSDNKFFGLLGAAGENIKQNENIGTEQQTVTAGQPSVPTNSAANTTKSSSSPSAGTASPQSTQMTNTDQKIDLKISIDAPSHIDTAQMTNVLNDPTFQQELIKAIQKASTNYGQTPNSNYPLVVPPYKAK